MDITITISDRTIEAKGVSLDEAIALLTAAATPEEGESTTPAKAPNPKKARNLRKPGVPAEVGQVIPANTPLRELPAGVKRVRPVSAEGYSDLVISSDGLVALHVNEHDKTPEAETLHSCGWETKGEYYLTGVGEPALEVVEVWEA